MPAKLTKMSAVIAMPNVAYSNIQPEVEADTAEEAMDFIRDVAAKVGATDYVNALGEKVSVKKTLMHLKSINGVEVDFDPEQHKYYDKNGEANYLSGSTLSELVCKPFDSAMIAQKVAKDGLTPQQVMKLWDMKNEVACDFGTSVHKAMETFQRFHMYKSILGGVEKILPNSDYLADVVRNFFTTERMKEQALPEVFVASDRLKLCGSIDRLVFLDKDSKTVIVQDFKGLALDTSIPTKDGFKTMGTLKVGDYVLGGDGNYCQVKNKSSIHHKKCYKITFYNGEEVVADHDHKWVVITNSGSKSTFVESMLSTEELKSGMKISIPVINAEAPDADLPVDPYVLGAWLGDGSKACGVITKPDKELWKEIASRGYTIGKDIGGKQRCETHTVFGLAKGLRQLGVLNNKHIPDEYILKASMKQRLDLLRGIMDTDGYWNKVRSRAVLDTTQEWFMRDVVRLVSSLGIKASVHPYTARGFGLIKQAWMVDFLPQDNPFLVRNQDIDYPKSTKKGDHKYIKSVEEVDSVPTQCIVVDSPDHTYLYGNFFTKTHNSNSIDKKVSFISEIAKEYKDVERTKLGEYKFQLSLYSLILRDMGYNVKCCQVLELNGTEWVVHEFKPLDITKALEIVGHGVK